VTAPTFPPPEYGVVEYGVVKYVAEVHGDRASFRVFTTGVPGTYLFDQMDPYGHSTCLQIPIPAKELRPDLRRALAAGWGLTSAGGHARLAKERAAMAARRARATEGTLDHVLAVSAGAP
jgi:hypothetical protein